MTNAAHPSTKPTVKLPVKPPVKPLVSKDKTRVLVIDNDEVTRSDLEQDLQIGGFEVAIARGVGAALLINAQALAQEFRPHVALVDLRLLDDYTTNDTSGLELATHLRPAQAILYSAYLSSEITSKAKKNGFSDWIPKYESPEVLIEAIRVAAQSISAAENSQQIRWPSHWDSYSILRTLIKDVLLPQASIINDIILQLFTSAKLIQATNINGNLSDQPALTHGNSVVFKVTPDDLEPAVLKISQVARIDAERSKYDQYINRRITGQFHTLLLDSKLFWDLGGILYSFMGSTSKIMPTFSDHYRNSSDPNKIVRPLQHFFTQAWYSLYEKVTIKENELLINEYDRDWKLRQRLQKVALANETITIPGTNIKVEHPGAWLLSHLDDSFVRSLKIAVVHGDFHGNNLFVDDDHTWAIDFERTGPCHILRDFVELEVDILTRLLPSNVTDLQYLSLLFAITDLSATGEPATQPPQFEHAQVAKAYAVISGLRKIAKEVTRFEDVNQYWWPLLFNSQYVAVLQSSDTAKQRRSMLLGAVLCERLQTSSIAEWPPKKWHTLTSKLTSDNQPNVIEFRLQLQANDQQKLSVDLIQNDKNGFPVQIFSTLPEYTFDTIQQRRSQSLREIGSMIGQAIFQDRIRSTFDRMTETLRPMDFVHIRLQIKDQTCTEIPWELLQIDGDFTSVKKQFCVTRATPNAKPPLQTKIQSSLRFMGIVTNPTSLEKLRIEDEVRVIEEALRQQIDSQDIQVEWVKDPSRESIRQRVSEFQPHIIHFIGHGQFNVSTNESEFALSSESMSTDWYSAEQLKTLVQNSPLCLAFVNCCDSAYSYAGFVQSLMQSGIPYAIGMAAGVYDQTAIKFAREFYKDIVIHGNILKAMTHGRRSIFNDAISENGQWALPVLYTSSIDGQLFDPPTQ